MSNELIVNVLVSIFGVIVSLFGISIAAVIALTQILQPAISHAQTWKLLKSRLIIATGVLMVFCIILCSLGIAGLTYAHDLVPGLNFGTNYALASVWYFLALITLILLSVAMTIRIIYQQSSLLIPQNALRHFEDNLNISQVEKYFEYKSSSRPFPPMSQYVIFAGDNADETQSNDEEAAKKYQKDLKRYDTIQKEGALLDNPLIPLESYLTAHIKKGDLFAFIATLKTFESIIQTISNDGKGKRHLNQIVLYYSKALERISENAVSSGSLSFMFEAVESSHRVALFVIKVNPSLVDNIQAYWQNTALDSMARFPIVFKRVMEAYRESAELIMKLDTSTERRENQPLQNIFRSLGWLGEKYLESHAPERSALMYSEHSTEFNSLMNAVLSFGWDYSRNKPETSYPLIYFDALYVIGRKLVSYYRPTNETDSYASDISNSLFSLMHEHQSYGEAACAAKNNDGAWLAVRGLKYFVEIFESNEYGAELKKQTLESLLRLGAAAYVNNLTASSSSHLGSALDYALKTLEEHAFDVDLTHEGSEIFIKSSGGNMDKTIEFLQLVGPKLGTDFGLKSVREQSK